VSTNPASGGEFLQSLLGDLVKMMSTDSPLQWELAFQLATTVAQGDAPPANIDPVERIRFEELASIAALHVADLTGMDTGRGATAPRLSAVTRSEWARRTLSAWQPLLDRLALSVGPKNAGQQSPGSLAEIESLFSQSEGDSASQFLRESPEDAMETSFGALFEKWAGAMAPAMLAAQIGSLVGHLAQRTLGEFDLPLPRSSTEEILVVPENIAGLADDWSLPLDDLRLWVCVRELTCHAVLQREHVRTRIEELVLAHAGRAQPSLEELKSRLLGLDPASGEGLAEILGDPLALAAPRPDASAQRISAELDALVATLAGYVEHRTAAAAGRVVGSHTAIAEAIRRRRVTRGEGETMAEALFGLRIGQEQVDRGVAFVQGVLDRDGDAELAKLWVVESNLPTPAEVDAPGLWIARVNLPADDGPDLASDDPEG
jgi:putative hydrolase